MEKRLRISEWVTVLIIPFLFQIDQSDQFNSTNGNESKSDFANRWRHKSTDLKKIVTCNMLNHNF